MTSALAQTAGSSGSSTGANDTGYDSARTGNGVSDSYGNTTDTKAIPSTDDAYGQSKKKNHGNDVGAETDLNKNSTGTSPSDDELNPAPGTNSFGTGSTGTSGDSEKFNKTSKSTTTTTKHTYGRTGTAGKHGGGGHDGGTAGKDGGM